MLICRTRKADFPISEACCSEYVSLPMYPELNGAQVLHTVESLKRILGQLPSIGAHYEINGRERHYTKTAIVS